MTRQLRIKKTPTALVERGEFNFGIYRAPFETVNPLDARLKLPRPLRRLALKEWQHFAIANDRFYISFALFDSKRINLAQIIVYDRKTRVKYEGERRFIHRRFQIPDALYGEASASIDERGLTIRVDNRLEQGRHDIVFSLEPDGTQPQITGRFTCFEDLSAVEPIVVCLPFEDGRGMYSHKGVFPGEGVLFVDGERHEFNKERSYILPDIHKGYYPFVMQWHWATAGCFDQAGRLVGFNLTDNQVEDQERYNENALWVDGRLSLLPPVHFEMNLDDLTKPAIIRDNEGKVNLRFIPEVQRAIDVTVLFLKSRYRGPYGHFEGTIVDHEGVEHCLDGAFGMAEDFYLRG